LVKVTPLDAGEGARRRVGFMRGRITVPDRFKSIGQDEIVAMFEGEG
jgi:hypothetical protein